MITLQSQNVRFYWVLEQIYRYASYSLATLGKIRSARRSRAVTRQLLTQDDRMLDDIGVSRSDVEKALASDWDTDPAATLAEIRRRRMQADRQGIVERRVR